MPYEARYYKAEKHIAYAYWGDLTAEEFLASFTAQAAFFHEMTGLVTVTVNAQKLDTIPMSILTHARNAPLARYRPLLLVIVGANAFVQAIANVFAKVTGIEVQHVATETEAEQFLRTRRVQRNRR